MLARITRQVRYFIFGGLLAMMDGKPAGKDYCGYIADCVTYVSYAEVLGTLRY